MHSISQNGFVWVIAVQPDSLKEDVFAAATTAATIHLRVLSIFDIRRSTTGKLSFNNALLKIIFGEKRRIN